MKIVYVLLITDHNEGDVYPYSGESVEALWKFALEDVGEYVEDLKEEDCLWYEDNSGFRYKGPGIERSVDVTYEILDSVFIE